ncbi:MAG TPA: hypothetical protein VFG36_05105 [Methanoregula sp.]|nr:hypothetical protein [Methanoregula sp.]
MEDLFSISIRQPVRKVEGRRGRSCAVDLRAEADQVVLRDVFGLDLLRCFYRCIQHIGDTACTIFFVFP